jgi:hypothetical protein
MFIDSTNAYPSERWEIEAKHLQKSFGQHEGRNVGDASWKTKNRMGYSLQRDPDLPVMKQKQPKASKSSNAGYELVTVFESHRDVRSKSQAMVETIC